MAIKMWERCHVEFRFNVWASSREAAWADGPIIDSSMMRRSGIARPVVGSVSVR
jgi:hypothetical protein